MKYIRELKQLKSIPFTHSTLVSILKDYKNPNDKIKEMVKNREIIRIKKSLYVVGDIYNDDIVSKELLANVIYGPSYISLDYALSYHGLIPERVYEITSVTTKNVKRYDTQFGRFTYIKSPSCLYSIGIDVKTYQDISYMIAIPEKALCDKIIYTKNLKITSLKSMKEYLLDDLRIDENLLKDFDTDIITKCILCGYKVKVLEFLYKVIDKLQMELS